ncbi:MAG TPA: family 10 glycosylhydrolase [Candidatus Eubacterium faecigallinarum]|nr:family 10 glycosylhydrolase [Candidatus Eubacterium faecigallinarum]
MYKKIISVVLIVLFLAGCTAQGTEKNDSPKSAEYVKAVWMTYYELSSFTQDNDEQEFKKQISKAFKELESNGFNRVTVQVRPFADAFYKSDYFPVSAYCFKSQGSELLYDPLAIMTEAAHKYGLSIEAWINPYRVSSSTDFSELSDKNKAVEWKDTDNLIVCDSGIYFNPASSEVTKLICNGVKEIVENYQVDSICFDDYFYPDTDKSIDESSYKAYTENSGELSLEDWRRENVSNMVKEVYSTVKSVNENITFGISPASDIENDRDSLYADVEKWCTSEGYIDYICPQIYFGFLNENQPFMKTTKNWIQMSDCTMYVALPLYKAGKEDEFAGDSGINEFVDNNNIIARQVTYLSKLESVKGFYIFSYSSLKDNDETKNLYSAMQ